MTRRIVVALVVLCAFAPRASTEDEGKHVVFEDIANQYTTTIFQSERDSILETFWAHALRRGIPYIEDNKSDVIFLYRGNDSARVYGDFTSWAFRIPMKRLGDSDLWYLKLSFEPDARLDYKFATAKGDILDPHNPRIVASGFGDHSELSMPDFSAAPELEEANPIAKGTTATLTVESKVLNYEHTVIVYLPAGYNARTGNYPVAYFQDGGEYIKYASAPTVFDNLIASNLIEPTIGVFVVPPTEAKRNRSTEYGLNTLYQKFFVTELIPFIDKKYRTDKLAQSRLVVGTSYGGLASLALAFNNPDSVANVASQSGFISFKRDTLFRLFNQSPAKPLRVYLAVGSYEKNVGRTIPVTPESDYLNANRRFSRMLEQKQYQVRYREFRDGHGWGRWRTELPNILRWFFPRRESE